MGSAPEEFQELKEHAEEAAHNRRFAPVSLTMAVLAVLLAICGMLGHRAHTEEGIAQTKVADQWAYYQAKKVVGSPYEIALDHEADTGLREKYRSRIEHYGEEEKEIEQEARKLEGEVAVLGRRATRFDLGDTFLEIALVVTSITLLTGKRGFWTFGLVLGAAGVIAGISTLFVR